MLSLGGTPIECNCDDEKTGIIDDNILRSKEQLPVQGTFHQFILCQLKTEF